MTNLPTITICYDCGRYKDLQTGEWKKGEPEGEKGKDYELSHGLCRPCKIRFEDKTLIENGLGALINLGEKTQ